MNMEDEQAAHEAQCQAEAEAEEAARAQEAEAREEQMREFSAEVEKAYQDFWKAIVERPDGTLDVDQVKRELFDFWRAMQEVPKVYSHITGGLLSKLLYNAGTVINAADEHYEEMYEEERVACVTCKEREFLEFVKSEPEGYYCKACWDAAKG